MNHIMRFFANLGTFIGLGSPFQITVFADLCINWILVKILDIIGKWQNYHVTWGTFDEPTLRQPVESLSWLQQSYLSSQPLIIALSSGIPQHLYRFKQPVLLPSPSECCTFWKHICKENVEYLVDYSIGILKFIRASNLGRYYLTAGM